MGISGLTTYISDHSARYLKYYELRDTYLVIDGNNISRQLYAVYADCNCAFGGDYDKYAQCVSNFIDELLICNVIPVVVMDGSYEEKKLKTILQRIKNKVCKAARCSPVNQQKAKYFPLQLTTVFIDVMREKNIRYIQCLLEADDVVAAVATALNCPVLSYDSDFYVYGTSYVPFNTLEESVFESLTGKGCMKRCKIYRIEYLLNSFEGLHQSMLPLAAVLLGNDYTDYGVFKNICDRLKLPSKPEGISKKHYCIEAIFIWLSKYTLEEAVIEILSTVPKSMQQEVLNIIKASVDSYTNASVEMTISQLGLSKYITQASVPFVNKSFKLDIDINSLVHEQEICDEKSLKTSRVNAEEKKTEIMDILGKSEFVFNYAILNTMPGWFLNDFLEGKYSGYFISMLVQCLYVCPVQVEDDYCLSSNVISLRIISVIFGLLKSQMDDKKATLKYVIRNQNKGIACHELEGTDIAPLSKLREIPLTARKEILNNTLGITNEQCINELLPEWMLYVACIKYWSEQRELYKNNKCYIYSLLVSMLFGLIDSKIGRHRIQSSFQNMYGQVIQTIERKKRACNYKLHYPINVTIFKARSEVGFDDCLLAAPFFMSHFEIDKRLHSNPQEFNRSIVHAFAEFQNCLDHSMHLNALLGNPYPQTKVARMFNGTLLYNLCNNFQTRPDLEGYINSILQDSPSLLRLFNMLLVTTRPLFPS